MGYVVPPARFGGCGWIAQLVEQRTENPCVASSTLALATILYPGFPGFFVGHLNRYEYPHSTLPVAGSGVKKKGGMKSGLTLIAVLFVGACATTPPTLESVAGTYEFREGVTYRVV